MCLAVPGKIIEVKNSIATVDYDIEKRKGRIIEKGYKKGDYVILQGGIVAQKVPEKEAVEALRLYKESVS